MFKFIHAADVHLDSPLKGLERYEGAPVDRIRTAARDALANLVDLAIQEQVGFVLIAGDLYDGNWRDMQTGFFFVNQAARLGRAGIPLYLIAGNHDAESRISRSLRLPENVIVFPSDAPHTELWAESQVAIHGQSFATAAVRQDLSLAYPPAKPGYFNIGLLHTSADGREGHDPYAPCSLEGLKSKGYDYWALGHVHTRETLCQEPVIAFSGNIQGRHARETGAKGCLLVSVHDGHTVNSEFRALDVFRWETAKVDIGSAGSVREALDLVGDQLIDLRADAEGRPLAVRLTLTGTCPIHRDLQAQKRQLIDDVRALSIDVGHGEIWIEKISIQTSPPRRQPSSELPEGAIQELAAMFQTARDQPSQLTQFGFDLSDALKKLPPELAASINVEDTQQLNDLICEAEALLMAQLMGTEVAR